MGWITAFSMAFGMFCAIPFPVRRWDERQRARMLVCFPWVGAIIGAIWAFACWLLRRIAFSGVLAGALLTALPLLLTGFIHLDGFMDCCDAIYSRRDLETRKKILKDSHCGAFAVVHLALYLLVFAGAMTEATAEPWLLVFLPVAPRCITALAVATMVPMQTSQYAGKENLYHKGHYTALFVTLAASMLLPVVLFGLPGFSVAVAAAVALLNVCFGVKQLGGMSGDISGFAITRGELGGVLALAVLIWLGGIL